MVLLHRIQKYFSSNGIKALDGVDFELRDGEIHALTGENGAGKSTLMHIMAGFLKPSEGLILVDGEAQRFSSPAKALASGIGMVRQHPHLVGDFTVWENCILGCEKAPWLVKTSLRGEIAALNDRWGFGLPLERPASELTVSQGQKAAILALLRRNIRYFIFDEPTAVLSPHETERLFELFRKLRDDGKGIVLISHKLNETLRLANRVTALRGGKTAATLDASLAGEKELSGIIFGTDRAVKPVRTGSRVNIAGPPALELQNLTVKAAGRPLIRGINLTLPRGTITGIAGVRDSGLETLELAVTGYLPSSGTILVNGTKLNGCFQGYGKNAGAFRNAGGAYLGTREKAELSVRDILVIHAHKRLQKHGFLENRKLAGWSRSIIKKAGLTGGDKVPASSFSGGQFQRLLFFRELAEKTPLLVLAEPGRGLDRKSREKLSILFRERAGEGSGVLIFSTDSEELLSVCDTVLVLRDGFFPDTIEIRKEQTEADYNAVRERIRKAMVGEYASE